jgi:hypothetical protein
MLLVSHVGLGISLYLAWVFITAPDSNPVLILIFFVGAICTSAYFLREIYKNAKIMRNRICGRRGDVRAEETKFNLIGPNSGNRYPLTNTQIERVTFVITALCDSKLLDDKSSDSFEIIAVMENEGQVFHEKYSDNISASEILYSLVSLYQDLGMEFHSMVAFEKLIEDDNLLINDLIQEFSAFLGFSIAQDNLQINRIASNEETILIRITINEIIHEIPCDTQNENAFLELVESFVSLMPTEKSESLYIGDVESSFVIARLTPEQCETFNIRMAEFDDPFRLRQACPYKIPLSSAF